MIIEFLAPGPLMNMNDRAHWRTRAAHTKAWRSATYLQTPREALQQPPCYVQVTLPVRDNRRRDPMNYVPTVKAIIDGLVDAGVWPDDNSEWVTVLEPKVAKGTDRVVTVELIPR